MGCLEWGQRGSCARTCLALATVGLDSIQSNLIQNGRSNRFGNLSTSLTARAIQTSLFICYSIAGSWVGRGDSESKNLFTFNEFELNRPHYIGSWELQYTKKIHIEKKLIFIYKKKIFIYIHTAVQKFRFVHVFEKSLMLNLIDQTKQ